MFVLRRLILILFALLCVGFTGCGGGPPGLPRASVSGTVTWEGAPIKEGTITFVPIGDTKGAPAAAIIRDGKYTLDAGSGPMLGTNRIEIIANRETGETIKAVPPATQDIRKVEQFIPRKFNQSSTLEKKVAAGKNEFNFELTAK